jgi:hypothetical protein
MEQSAWLQMVPASSRLAPVARQPGPPIPGRATGSSPACCRSCCTARTIVDHHADAVAGTAPIGAQGGARSVATRMKGTVFHHGPGATLRLCGKEIQTGSRCAEPRS